MDATQSGEARDLPEQEMPFGQLGQAEEWRVIDERPAYSISSFGRVRNNEGLVLKPWAHRSGHLYITLCRDVEPTSKLRRQVHRLVLTAFVGKCPSGQEARHLDGVPTNNMLTNLVWGTRSENILDLRDKTGFTPHATIGMDVAERVRQMFTGKHGDRTRIARKLGVSQTAIGRILNNHTHRPRETY